MFSASVPLLESSHDPSTLRPALAFASEGEKPAAPVGPAKSSGMQSTQMISTPQGCLIWQPDLLSLLSFREVRIKSRVVNGALGVLN